MQKLTGSVIAALVGEAKSRAGTEADLVLTPVRPERPPSSVETSSTPATERSS